ncbi:MAG: sugar O-acetyltransferase [Oscillospiraceae bacterium]|nr:sugar O-acetyltransferase [Oscillospiraceae bacterium]
MTEREKMLRGELYDANFDPEILGKRLNAENLCYDYNSLRPDDPERGAVLARLLCCEVPEGLTLLSPVYFDYGPLTRFGTGVFVNHGCYFMDGGGITIGDNTFIGPFCGFYTAAHPLDYDRRNQGLEWAKPICVGKNCWFGANVSVMPGVTIGDGCVIAAGSVVTADIPENSLAAGVPAVVKKRIEQGR